MESLVVTRIPTCHATTSNHFQGENFENPILSNGVQSARINKQITKWSESKINGFELHFSHPLRPHIQPMQTTISNAMYTRVSFRPDQAFANLWHWTHRTNRNTFIISEHISVLLIYYWEHTDCGVKQLHNVAHAGELLVLLAIVQPIQVLLSAAPIIQIGYSALEPFQMIYTLLSIRSGRAHVDKTIE